MKKTKKQDLVQTLSSRLAESPNIYLTDFTGITVKRMTELRRRFRAEGAEYVVVKNTLALRALHDNSMHDLDDVLVGPTGMVLAGADPVTAAKILADFQKEEADRPSVKAGLLEGAPVGPEEVKRLAGLPTRDALMGMVAGAMQAPMQAFAGALDSLLYQFVGSLEALRAQREDAA